MNDYNWNKPAGTLDWAHLILLIILGPAAFLLKGNYVWLLLLVPAFWAIRRFYEKKMFPPTLLDIPIRIIIIITVLGQCVNGNWSHSLPKVIVFFFSLAFYYATTALMKTKKVLKFSVLFFLVGGCVFSAVGLLGMHTTKVKHLDFLMKLKEKIPQVNFNLAGAENGFAPNPVGGLLLLFLPLAAVLCWLHRPVRRRKPSSSKDVIEKSRFLFWVFLFISLFLSVTLALTQSRGAWLAFILTTFLLFLITLYYWKKLVMWIVLAASLAFLFLFPQLTRIDAVALTSRQAQGTMIFRLQIWDQALPRILGNPFLGVGFNEFRYLPEIKYEESHAHNKLLHLAVEMGVPAASAYLALLVLVGYMTVSGYKKAKDSWIKYSILGLGAGHLAHALFELTDVIPFGSIVGVIPWFSLALLGAICQYELRNASQSGPLAEPQQHHE